MKKIIIIILLLLITALPLLAQKASSSDLINMIRKESFDIAVLEEEIEYYKTLLNKKEQIKRLYDQRRLSVIRELFERDLAELDLMFEREASEEAIDKLWEIEHLYKDIETLDIKNYFPEQKLQYYEARILVRDAKYKQARTILENNLVNNLDPQNRNAIVALLEEVYFELERYEDIISVYPVYRGVNSPQQRWWLGQALYNTSDYEKALPVFQRLAVTSEYELRAQAMLALIKFNLGNVQQAITDFNTIKYKYSPDEPYYNFINLSLARLYVIAGNSKEAVNLYDQYVQLEDEVADDVLFEIALFYKTAEEYNQAIKYFRQITQKKKKSSYYVAAKYLIAITEQDRGNYDSGRESLRQIIDSNQEFMEALNRKYALLEEYSTKLTDLVNPMLNSAQREELDRELEALENEFRSNQQKIESLSQGMETNKLLYLSLLEEEYFAYTVTLADFETFVKFTRNPVLRRLPLIKNYKMTRQDSSIVYLQIVDYMEGHENKKTEMYETAKFLAEQKVYQTFVRNIWYDIYHLSLQYNSSEITAIADRADSLVSQNLELIEDAENLTFKQNKAQFDLIERKEENINANNQELQDLEKDFISAFSTYITPDLSQELENFADTQNEIRVKYIETITALVEDISNENRMYKNTLLEILFRQTMLLDEEYNQFRENISNE